MFQTMDNSTFAGMSSGLLSWRSDLHLCIFLWVAFCFILKHLFLWILSRLLRESLLKDAIEYYGPCLASPLDISEKRSSSGIASSLDIHEKPLAQDGDIEYDVFINYHKNEDSANRFVDNLYEVLKSCGVRAFVKSGEEKGEVLNDMTKNVISNATLCLAIFSREYAQSPKCLSELYEMVQNGKKVIPLFFDIEPSDARWIKRSYAEAFQQHGEQKKFENEMVKWKDALHVASLIIGWELAQFKRDVVLAWEYATNRFT